ncbi:hypothetical protein BDQ17DRAFT_1171804, partial [Cyathus striatus]
AIMSTSNSTTLVQNNTSSTEIQDCLACRVVGSASFTGIGSYALWQSRAAAPGALVHKRMLGGLGVGMLI